MSNAADRVEAFLDARATMRGLDQDMIHSANDNDLTASDLRALVALARAVQTLAPRAARWIEANHVG